MTTTIVSKLEGARVAAPIGAVQAQLADPARLEGWAGPLARLVVSDEEPSVGTVRVAAESPGRVVATGSIGGYAAHVAFSLQPESEDSTSVDAVLQLTPIGTSTVLVPVQSDEAAAAVRAGLATLESE